ncbi:MAG: type II toxin-antitoxin system RelE/ParE family toxin [Xanthomonadales bacterium PRO7]|nr:type II toxin-antitoxin system RelE/ParE family toxin [Xanthomonadales bacterium PRO7]
MAWRIELSALAHKTLRSLDRAVAQRILRFLHERIAPAHDPRSVGEALKGSKLGGFWKYRVGDYRLIAHIDDGVALVLVLRIGHRREVYR